eukprot:754357-Hanusia_phi.AAC.1
MFVLNVSLLRSKSEPSSQQRDPCHKEGQDEQARPCLGLLVDFPEEEEGDEDKRMPCRIDRCVQQPLILHGSRGQQRC